MPRAMRSPYARRPPSSTSSGRRTMCHGQARFRNSGKRRAAHGASARRRSSSTAAARRSARAAIRSLRAWRNTRWASR
ncbi:heavy metal RND efflux outer membrane protein CzcC family [Ralstonia phage RPZH3]|nr:heavy metal RND efflux outer membrane protein CzcC family [Ralstonia phage RPZH3]